MSEIAAIVPACLRELPQWVAWKYVDRAGKQTKAPINSHTGDFADSTDAATCSTFDQAREACERDVNLAGVGLVFTADDPYCGVDLDNCRDGESGKLKSCAIELVERFDSYTEVSPSGTGVKIFLKASKPGCRCRKAYHDGEVEIYDRGRFFTVTGDRLQEYPTEVNLRQESLDLVYASVFGGDEARSACSSGVDPSRLTGDCATAALTHVRIRSRFHKLCGSGSTEAWRGPPRISVRFEPE